MIIFGPGSLYTSIIPNLLVDGIVEAVRKARGLKVYVANVMTQEGETEGYTLSDHIHALFEHAGGGGLFDLCLVNSAVIPEPLLARYAQEGAEPLRIDQAECEKLGVELAAREVAGTQNGLVRHDPDRLAAALLEIHGQRSVRIAGSGSYRMER